MTAFSIDKIKQLMEKVNDYWIGQNPGSGICAWERSVYFLGDMAAYDVLKKQNYLEYALKWANDNDWRFYGAPEFDATNADCILCGETYLDLMDLTGQGTDEHIVKAMEYVLNDEKNDYWWWVDAIHMALPLFNKMGLRYNDSRYFDKAYKLFCNTKTERGCYDVQEHLWFRDERFLPEKMLTQNGKKVFWSRGNGWVFAGLARTLGILPKNNKYYNEYLTVFKEMASSLAKCIQPDGFWRTSLIDPGEYDVPETSGTVFFILGYLMGINLGILDDSYMETVYKGFDGLIREALLPDGRIGWVQLVADCPGEPKKEDSNDYAVGAFLLVCRELLRKTGGY